MTSVCFRTRRRNTTTTHAMPASAPAVAIPSRIANRRRASTSGAASATTMSSGLLNSRRNDCTLAPPAWLSTDGSVCSTQTPVTESSDPGLSACRRVSVTGPVHTAVNRCSPERKVSTCSSAFWMTPLNSVASSETSAAWRPPPSASSTVAGVAEGRRPAHGQPHDRKLKFRSGNPPRQGIQPRVHEIARGESSPARRPNRQATRLVDDEKTVGSVQRHGPPHPHQMAVRVDSVELEQSGEWPGRATRTGP